jgi:hypothetical protein
MHSTRRAPGFEWFTTVTSPVKRIMLHLLAHLTKMTKKSTDMPVFVAMTDQERESTPGI